MITTKNAKYAKRFEIRDCPSLASEYGFFSGAFHPSSFIPHPLLVLCTILLLFIEVYELFRLDVCGITSTQQRVQGLSPSTGYWWRIDVVNEAGAGPWSEVRSFTTCAATAVDHDGTSPSVFRLDQNYPNPFSPMTTISFTIPTRSFVSLKVFDALGKEVANLVSEEMAAGAHSHQFNAVGLRSGVYFYRLQAGKFSETRTLILMR